MVRIDLDLEGFADLRESFNDLEDKYGEASTRIVTSGAEYSIHLEYGRGPIEADDGEALRFTDEDGNVIYRTRVSGHPPYPFFYPAVAEYRANPETFLLKNTELSGLDAIQSTDDLIESVASALQQQMRRNANANRSGRSPGTHPEHPKVDTGNLVARITVVEV